MIDLLAAISLNLPFQAQGGKDGWFSIFISNLLYWAAVLAVISVVISGFMYTTSAGDPGKLAKAKRNIIYSIIGLLLAVFSYAIVNEVVKLI